LQVIQVDVFLGDALHVIVGYTLDRRTEMITYARLYADEFGESHFEDVELALTSTDYAPPALPLSLSAFLPASQIGFMNAPAGWTSDWHPSSGRTMFF